MAGQPSPVGSVPPTTIAPPGVPVRQIKEMIVSIVIGASKPISFDDIYKRLEEMSAPLPKDKPKLLVRQILYNKNTFQVGSNGAFTLTPIAAAAAKDGKNKTLPPTAPVVPAVPAVPAVAPLGQGQTMQHKLDSLLGNKP